jgi:putative restriction endonuclease
LVAYWWVNQSKTYRAERSAGIMWAPQQTAAGRRLGHWTAMTQLQAGDVVVHYARGAI